jgi:hypothetical protein
VGREKAVRTNYYDAFPCNPQHFPHHQLWILNVLNRVAAEGNVETFMFKWQVASVCPDEIWDAFGV